jgi:hypothetical protein
MSKIQVNDIVNHFDTGAPDCPKGLNVTGTGVTANSLNVSGVSTISNVVVGGATTELIVNGDARVTGILTVGTASVTLNGNDGTISGINTVNGVSFPSAGPLGNRNLIINGACRLAQRATSSSGNTASGFFSVDRIRVANQTLGTWTYTQESDGPPGFSKSWKANCTTADASPDVSDYMLMNHAIEGQDLQVLDFGNSTAKSSTISFWVKSNKTGGASFEMQQKDNSDRQVTFQYTINTADTWEYKVINIPADTAGVIDDDSGTGMRIGWWLNSGTNYTGGSHATTWETEDNTDRNPSNLGVGGAVNDYFQITGIQWELGNQATPFEHRSLGDELLKCQRYFYSSGTESTFYSQRYSTSNSFVCKDLPVVLRADPHTITYTAGGGGSVSSTNYTRASRFQLYVTGDTTVTVTDLRMDSEIS